MKRLFNITLNVSTDDMLFSKVPAIKALRQLTGMELKPALAIVNEAICAGIEKTSLFELNAYEDEAVIDNAIANFNSTGFTIEMVGDLFVDKLTDLLYKAEAADDKEMAAHVSAVIKYYEKG